jgi:hypothetical protein
MRSKQLFARQPRLRQLPRAGSRYFRVAGPFALGAVAVSLISLATGCGGSSLGAFAEAPTTTKGDSTCLSVEADWNDIDAAVDAAATHGEMGVLSRNPGPTWGGQGGDQLRRSFHLKTVRDEPVLLEITRGVPPPQPAAGAEDPHHAMVVAFSMPSQPDSDAPVLLDLCVKVGRFGHPEREQHLLRAIAHRLDQLKGVETFPSDD